MSSSIQRRVRLDAPQKQFVEGASRRTLPAIAVALAVSLLCVTPTLAADVVIDFEDLTLSPESFYNGNPGGTNIGTFDGSFTSGGVKFPNVFTRELFGTFVFESWSGWSYSNQTDITTPGFGNQYSAYSTSGGGVGGTGNYGVSFDQFDSAITIGDDFEFKSIDITNTTYTALSMLQGDSFAKQFGGPTGNDPDYFKLTITGLEGGTAGNVVGEVEFYLADYRFADNSQDYVVDDWTTVDLTSLAGADTLMFAYETTDIGTFGPNTPAYFAADNLVLSQAVVPEPSSLAAILVAGVALVWTLRGRRRR